MANVIIGIHGLGNKPHKELLEYWWKISMKEGLKRSGFKSSLPKFEMVYWADIIFDKPLDESEKDINSKYYLDEVYTEATANSHGKSHNIRIKLMDFLNRHINKIFLNEDFTLNYSFITDAIVNRYFKELEIYYSSNCTDKNNQMCMAKDLIRQRLYDKLKEYRNNNIMLVSHSMGSIIAFDVLTFMAPHIGINTFVTMGAPLGLPVIISKIAAEQKQILNGENHMITPPSVFKNWYNFSDILDKIAFNYKLADDFSENNYGIKPVDFMVVNDYIKDGVPNPHKSCGYLRTPEFSKVLHEFIQSEKISLKQKIIRSTGKIIHDVKTQISVRKKGKK